MKKVSGKTFVIAAALAAIVGMMGCSSEIGLDEELAVLENVNCRSVVASNVKTFTCAPDLYEHVWTGYENGDEGPISVTKATLEKGSSKKAVYVVALSGTEIVKGQSTGYLTDLLSGFNLENDYSKNVVNVITTNIPKGSNIILAGHSLGGMIAQQVAANKTVKNRYNILNVVTFGSPLLSAGEREGTVIRLGDKNDAVPYLSGSLFNNTVWALAGLNREDGNYKFASEAAHCDSYRRTDLWGKYDVTGAKKGNAKLIMEMNTMKYYFSPTSWEK